MPDAVLLTTREMAQFVAEGFLRFDGVVPAPLNRMFVKAIGEDESAAEPTEYPMDVVEIPEVVAGMPLVEGLRPRTPIGEIVRLPQIRGAIESLVGAKCLFDHHFVHVLPPSRFYIERGIRQASQHLHQDSTIDPRKAFDIQLFYFPHAVTEAMGGTRFLPGSHLRIVNEMAIARYQNVRGQQHVVCPAGTVIVMHHGMWHGGGVNRTESARYMYKLRLNPSERQVRLWNTSDLNNEEPVNRPIFFVKQPRDPNSVATVLMRPQPWFEQDSGRLEYIQRILFWRRLLGDETFDVDYWVSRLECEPD